MYILSSKQPAQGPDPRKTYAGVVLSSWLVGQSGQGGGIRAQPCISEYSAMLKEVRNKDPTARWLARVQDRASTNHFLFKLILGY